MVTFLNGTCISILLLGSFAFLLSFYLLVNVRLFFNLSTLFFLYSSLCLTLSLFPAGENSSQATELYMFVLQKEGDYHCLVQRKTCFPYLITFMQENSCPLWKIMMLMGLLALCGISTGDKPVRGKSDRIVSLRLQYFIKLLLGQINTVLSGEHPNINI